MKSFTKPELIQDVTSDILKHWTPDKTMRNYFPGVIAGMKKNGSNYYFLLKPIDEYLTNPDFDTISEKAAVLFMALNNYCNCAETHPGELWKFYNNEYERITTAINESLIKAVQEIKTA